MKSQICIVKLDDKKELKKEYNSPQIVELGNVADFTRDGSVIIPG